MAQSSDSPLPQPPSSSASQASIVSVAQPGNASACLTHTSSLGPWILDSGASDHLSGNKDLFSSITTTSALPTDTLANGSQTVAKGIGLALPLPSLPLTSVLYTPVGLFISWILKMPSFMVILPRKFIWSNLLVLLRRSLYGLKQSPRAWFSRFSSVVQEFGMLRSTADHSIFYHHNSLGQCIYLVVYVDDIVITGSDQDGIQKLKQHFFTHFQTKDLGKLKYFLGIEIAQSSSGVVLSQRKYALDILEETGMLDYKPVDTLMDPNVKLVPGQGEPLGDPGRYRRLVGKLNYLTITRPDISFPMSVVSQFLQSPCDSHWDAVIRILRYIKSTPGQGVLYENRGHTQVVGYTDADWAGSPTDRRSTSGYCVFIGGNLISWKSKKQDMKLICDNQAALHIASNPVFHERTKHIEVDCHFIREKIASGCVATSFVNSNDQLADIFTKSLRGLRIKYICNKLGAYDVYAPA
uniref:Uncharacterized protein n=1 Tax=Vitis vinifera TaxID=29760 RepID=A5APK3_VITVI|nr:hypothetical protein VITISV_015958 [Vitis vinifera]